MLHDAAPLPLQRRFWNDWNATTREIEITDISIRQAEVVSGWLNSLNRKNLEILEVGCGSGWFCPELATFGRLTATDLSDEVLERARQRLPQVSFVAGDFMALQLGSATFDVIVTLEVLSHVADQRAFVEKLFQHLRPGGYLMMATQNRFVLEHYNRIPPPAPGQIRHWVDRRELRDLLEGRFEVERIFAVTPKANRGPMRLVTSRKLNWPFRLLFGDRLERVKESLGLGWTLMVLARKPTAQNAHPE